MTRTDIVFYTVIVAIPFGITLATIDGLVSRSTNQEKEIATLKQRVATLESRPPFFIEHAAPKIDVDKACSAWLFKEPLLAAKKRICAK